MNLKIKIIRAIETTADVRWRDERATRTRPAKPRGAIMIDRFLPMISLVAFFGVGVVWRMAVQRRRYGSLGLALFSRGSLLGALSVLACVVLFAQAVVAIAVPALLAPITVTASPSIRILGASLVIAATALMALAQLDLGASWRIGIEHDAKPGLVTSGLYRVSRNPIFACMLAAFVGIALTLPTWLSVVISLAACTGTHMQVAAEERWLRKTYGDDYRAYAARVARYLPIPSFARR